MNDKVANSPLVTPVIHGLEHSISLEIIFKELIDLEKAIDFLISKN